MCTCIRPQIFCRLPSIFSLIMHWKPAAFQSHLALDNSSLPDNRASKYNVARHVHDTIAAALPPVRPMDFYRVGGAGLRIMSETLYDSAFFQQHVTGSLTSARAAHNSGGKGWRGADVAPCWRQQSRDRPPVADRAYIRTPYSGSKTMKKPKKDRIRENRIHNEAIVDTYGPEEQALGRYYYLENQLGFLFQARCIAARVVSRLRRGETVEVLRMAPENACSADMLVLIRWHGRNMPCPCLNWPEPT